MAKTTGDKPNEKITPMMEYLQNNPEKKVLHARLGEVDKQRVEAWVDYRTKKGEQLKALAGVMVIGTIVTVAGIIETPLDAIPIVGDAAAKGTEWAIEGALSKLLFGKSYKELIKETGHSTTIKLADGLGDVISFLAPPGTLNPASTELLPVITAALWSVKEGFDYAKANREIDKVYAKMTPAQQKAFDETRGQVEKNMSAPIDKAFAPAPLAA